MTVRIPQSQAFRCTRENGASKWPERGSEVRRGDIILPKLRPSFKIKPDQPVFTIGSCFARNIESALKNRGYSVPAFEYRLPKEELYGVTQQQSGFLNKYTPQSMLQEIAFAFGDTDGSEYLIEVQGGWIDGQCHSNKPVSLERALARRQEVRDLYRTAIKDAGLVIITFGLIEAWWDRANQNYLNATPYPSMISAHQERFDFEILDPIDAINCATKTVELIREHGGADTNIMVTVSPIPLQRTFAPDDVLTANCYSKSVLRVAAEAVVNKFDRADYYPSYESISVSDPDATWEDDMVHVKLGAVKENVERMIDIYSA
ncbi:GSCFA domain-containing protein [Paracoccus aminophilus]|uniref:GSCFA domain-containing protein n=1 Tax=Paracoccus aminophilus JCM 7686 TaxID=1367847 RepID=S5XTM4_PARAH|nr:GSCFA domain-containing protein [Paracoccus aminophilus]AGT08527.1 hypothetical protein JCM7686_1426 [Paracoccus aminophilus JCM 7686]